MTTTKRRAEAVWTGPLKQGRGHFDSGSRVLSADYSFGTRFAGKRGTNPEELIAAAHASCFSMALAFYLEQAGAPPERIRASADVLLEIGDDGPSIGGVELRVSARVPNLSDAVFQKIAKEAKEACLVSRLLKTPITLEARPDDVNDEAPKPSRPAPVQVVLCTDDVERLKSFYTQLLGAEEYDRVRGRGGPFFVSLRLGPADLVLVADKRGAAKPGRAALAVFVESVEDLLPRVEAAGGKVLGPANDMRWGHRVAHITDPDGNLVNLTQQL